MKALQLHRIQKELIREELDVPDRELARLLGYPRDSGLSPGAVQTARETSRWYRTTAGPRVSLREFPLSRIEPPRFWIADTVFESSVFSALLQGVEAEAVVVAGFSAGREVTPEVRRLWNEDLLNESYVLDAYASAVVEQLLRAAYLRLCQQASSVNLSAIPHYSPGYDGWNLMQQSSLYKLLSREDPQLEIDLQDSGMLAPEKSLLAVFGVTARTDLAAPVARTPCDRCGLKRCTFRRSAEPVEAVGMVESSPSDSGAAKEAGNMNEDSKKPYYFPEKALEKWARQHLSIKDCGGGALDATFSYHGTTCALSGLPLQFDYDVRLEKEGEGYRIVSTGVEVEDHYYKAMCGSTTFGKRFRSIVEADLPLRGELLESIFRWEPEMSPAGCLCLQSHRDHKWRLVFETIHFSLGRKK